MMEGHRSLPLFSEGSAGRRLPPIPQQARVGAVMAGARTRAQVVIVANPHSGGGKSARYGLVQRAEDLGAQVWTTSAGRDAASLARNAVQDEAQVLGWRVATAPCR